MALTPTHIAFHTHHSCAHTQSHAYTLTYRCLHTREHTLSHSHTFYTLSFHIFTHMGAHTLCLPPALAHVLTHALSHPTHKLTRAHGHPHTLPFSHPRAHSPTTLAHGAGGAQASPGSSEAVCPPQQHLAPLPLSLAFGAGKPQTFPGGKTGPLLPRGLRTLHRSN